ncbi:phospholipase A [Bdellovibrio sp. HCB209]|uniref:phospholipase A n=1 Tax=Bdellovibrio sp. HCB209 TaxID=3394354 RepID=UPI0039B5618B
MKYILCILFLWSASLHAQTSAGAPEVETQGKNALINQSRKITVLDKQEQLRILYYKPIYFAYGDPTAKLQFSFRVPLFDQFGLNFAYSQIIFWELQEESKPFLDATYNPEIFYRVKYDKPVIRSIDYGAWEHNSNGKAGDESRSYDQSYIRANWAFESKSWVIQTSAKAKYIWSVDETNRDVNDYIGPWELEFKFIQLFDSIFDQLEAVVNVNPGGKWGTEFDKGGYQLSFNFHLGGLKVVPAFYLQYYHGYAETLVNYDQSVDEVRAGFMF